MDLSILSDLYFSCNLSQIKTRCVAIVRMKQPTNFGETCQEVRFFILVLCPSKSVCMSVLFQKQHNMRNSLNVHI